MLVHLAIRDLATIEATALELEAGLNVLTGETGAGKSIIVGALNLVLGDRARSDTIRKGADSAEVQALFRVPSDHPMVAELITLDLLDPSSLDQRPVELLIRRIVSSGGRGRVYVNDRMVTVRALASVMRGYVDIASQHAHGTLREPGTHLAVLDGFGVHRPLVEAYTDTWSRLGEARQRAEDLAERQRQRIDREDYLRFQLDELDRAGLEPGLEATLQERRARLRRSADIRDAATQAERLLTGDEGGAVEALRRAHEALDALSTVDPALGPLATRLEEARLETEDVAFECRRHGEQIALEPKALADTERRLTLVKRLARRHGVDTDTLCRTAEALRQELEAFTSIEDRLAEVETEVATLEAEAHGLAARLTDARQEAAQRFDSQVTAELAQLSMKGATVRFSLRRAEVLGPRGVDEGEIHIRPNVGEAERPLHRVASGGELSRLLLAIKTVLGDVDAVGVAIFDEIDAGIGGRVAEAVGETLARIARGHQVIAITHLAQVAAPAHQHLVVHKRTRAGRTLTEVRALSARDRTEEVARMLGGHRITAKVRAHAAELLRAHARQAALLPH